jgi:HEAT repeat protein
MKFPAKYRPVLTVPLVWLSGCGLGPLSQIAERDPIISLAPPDPLVALERSSQNIEADLDEGGMFTADLRQAEGGADADRLMQLTRSRRRMRAAAEELEGMEEEVEPAASEFLPPSRRQARGPALDASDPTLPPRRSSRSAAAPAPVATQASLPPYARRQARQARAQQRGMQMDGAALAEADRIDRAVDAQAERAELAAITEAELAERRLLAEAELIERLARAETELAERVALAKEERDRRIEVARQERELRMAIAGIASEEILDSSKLDRARERLEAETVAANESRWTRWTRIFRRDPVEAPVEETLTGEEVLAAMPNHSAKAIELEREKAALERAIAKLKAQDEGPSSIDNLLERREKQIDSALANALGSGKPAEESESSPAKTPTESLHPSLLEIPASAWADSKPAVAKNDEAAGPREMPLLDTTGPSLLDTSGPSLFDDELSVADSNYVPPAPVDDGVDPSIAATPEEDFWILGRGEDSSSLLSDSGAGSATNPAAFPGSENPLAFPELPGQEPSISESVDASEGPLLGLLPRDDKPGLLDSHWADDQAKPAAQPDNPWASAQPLVAEGQQDSSSLPRLDWSEPGVRTDASLATVTHSRLPSAREELRAAEWEQQSLLDACPPLSRELQQLVLQLDIPEVGVRKAVLADLAALGEEAQPALPAVRVLLDDSPLVAAHAAWTIFAIDPSDGSAQDELLQLMQTEDAEVVQFAAYALGSMGPTALPAAAGLRIERERHTGATRLHIAEALSRIDAFDTASVEVLINSLSDSHQNHRWLAALALGQVNPRHASQVVPALTASLRDTDPEVRSAAALSLGGFGTTAASAIPELESRAATDAPSVQEAARTALACIRE